MEPKYQMHIENKDIKAYMSKGIGTIEIKTKNA